MNNEERRMKNYSLSDKIKALGWAVMQLVAYYKQFNYIVCDKSGLIKLLEKTPYICEDKNCWASKRFDRCEIIYTTEQLANWRELCFSREDCEAWALENVGVEENVVVAFSATTTPVCKKNLQAQPTVKVNLTTETFTTDEIDLIKYLVEVKVVVNGGTPKLDVILAKCNQILKGVE